jgi:cyclopropane fatty-acyl-phospholipid synthase-like methyltransferase
VTAVDASATYTPAWQKKRRWTHEWSRAVFLGALAHVGVPRTMLDVGCGDGHLVELAARLGIYSVGVDISLMQERVDGSSFVLLRADLTKPCPSLRAIAEFAPAGFDLVLCWETAEHLPASAADQLVETIVQHTAPRGLVLFTAAPPGQGGTGHVNEQPPAYWSDKFVAAGFCPVHHHPLRATWEAVSGWCWWYPANLQVFARQS